MGVCALIEDPSDLSGEMFFKDVAEALAKIEVYDVDDTYLIDAFGDTFRILPGDDPPPYHKGHLRLVCSQPDVLRKHMLLLATEYLPDIENAESHTTADLMFRMAG